MAQVTYRKRPATRRVLLHASHTVPSKSNLEVFLAVNGRRMGLLSVGYHFLILRDGKVVSTRPHDTIGAHCRGYNEDSIGVCLAGGAACCGECFGPCDAFVPTDNFTPDQKDSLRGLMAYLRQFYGRLPLLGHSEVNQHHRRQCPPINMENLRACLSSVS